MLQTSYMQVDTEQVLQQISRMYCMFGLPFTPHQFMKISYVEGENTYLEMEMINKAILQMISKAYNLTRCSIEEDVEAKTILSLTALIWRNITKIHKNDTLYPSSHC